MAVDNLREPVMVSGLPDSGRVASLVIEHLVKELKATRFVELYSYGLPAQVNINPDGTVDILKHEMYFWRNPDHGPDLVLHTGDAQPSSPEGAYSLAEKALEIASSIGVRQMITVAAFITGEFVEEPKLHVTGTDLELIAEVQALGAVPIKEGNITWMNGLMVGLAKLHGIRAAFISGETSGFVVDAKAAKAVLELVSKRLGITVDTKALAEQAKETQRMVRSLEEFREKAKQQTEGKGYIR